MKIIDYYFSVIYDDNGIPTAIFTSPENAEYMNSHHDDMPVTEEILTDWLRFLQQQGNLEKYLKQISLDT